MRKVWAAVFCLALTIVCFAGCGKSSSYQGYIDPEGVAHVVFMGRDVESERANYQRVVDSFNAAQKKIKVRMEWFTDANSYNTMLDGLGKNLPDCLMLSNAMFLRYVSSGKLYDYKARLVQEELDLLYEDGYSAYCYDPSTKSVGASEGAGVYGLPKDMGPVAMCYNADLLKAKVEAYNRTATAAEQIDYDRVTDHRDPMTFSQFLSLGKKLKTVMGPDQYVCAGYDLQSAVYSNAADFFTDDTASTAAVGSDNFAGAVGFLQALYKEGIRPPASTISSGQENLFIAGNALFFYAGPWKTKDYWSSIGFEWDLIPMLSGDAEGAESTCYVGGMGFVVSNDSPVRDYAVEFLKYVALDLGAQRSLYANGQCIPNLKELAEEYATNAEELLAAPQPAHRSVWLDCIDGTGEKAADGSAVTDRVGGRYRAEAYTYDSTWFTLLSDYMGGNSSGSASFWQPRRDGTWVDVAEALKAFEPKLQQLLDEMRAYLV